MFFLAAGGSDGGGGGGGGGARLTELDDSVLPLLKPLIAAIG